MSGLITTRRALIGAGLAGAGAAGWGLLSGGSGDGSSQRRPGGGMVRVATQSASTADTLDPAKGALSTDYVRHFMLYSGLTKTGPDLIPQPSLAENIESADRTLWRFRLRRGVQFHDGAELTSADVVWSLQRHLDPAVASKVASIAEQFAEVKADGKYEVLIRLTGANADLPAMLSQSHFLIVRDGEAKPSGNGTGAFILDDFRPGVRTVARKNSNYFIPDRPRLERVELVAIPDDVSRVNALLSGDVHLVNAIDPRSAIRVEDAPGYGVLATPSSLYTDLVMRQDSQPTGNPHFVAAVKHLIDRQLIKRALFRGYAEIGNDHPIPSFHPYFNPEIPQTELDIDRARWHVQQGGLSGIRMPLYASSAAKGSVDMASILQEYGAQVGLEFAVNRVPADGYWSTHWMRHPFTFGNINPRPTADLIFSQFFQSDADWNESAWKNKRFDRLLIEARGASDEALRKELYGEMQALVRAECGIGIPVFISLIDAHDSRLKGLEPVSLGGLMAYQFAEYAWWDEA